MLNHKVQWCRTLLFWLFLLIASSARAGLDFAEVDFKGNLGFQLQGFLNSAEHQATQSVNTSVSGEIELYTEIESNSSSLTITPFFRVDQNDSERTHFDLRELLYIQSADTWEFKLGIGQVFWGVAESRNIVDIINQFDQVESVGTSQKLGQPLINYTYISNWGDFGVFVLPWFRERTFAGKDGRPRIIPVVKTDEPMYESSKKESHIDFAFRYSMAIDEWDLGLSFFNGTSRIPVFVHNPQTGNLRPLYTQLTQFGLDVQATFESWLLKLEAAHLAGRQLDNHIEVVTGVEYSFYGVAESNLDIGVVAEYLGDDRSTSTQVFQNDILLGLRFALNDEQSSEALIGFISDLDGNGDTLTIEANRRIGSTFKLTAEGAIWLGSKSQLRSEDYLQLEFGYFF